MKAGTGLSSLKCQKATPKTKPYSIPDGGGLGLLITPEGGRLWRWRYRFEGAMKQMAFGKYPDVSLTDARSYHAQARQLLTTRALGNASVRVSVSQSLPYSEICSVFFKFPRG